MALSLAVPALAQNEIGNGGEYLATEFTAVATRIQEGLARYPDAEGLFRLIDRSQLAVAIAVTRIDVVDTELFDRFGNAVDCRTIDDPRQSDKKLVQLNRSRMDALFSRGARLERLVLHEYLHVLGVPDENYQVSRLYDSEVMDPPRDCQESLTEGGKYDSRLLRLHIDQLPETEELTLEYALSAVKTSLKTLGCDERDWTLASDEREHAACTDVVPSQPLSRTCYLPLRRGSFVVAFNGSDGVTILYNRWD
jgi:hypothetical protein